MPIPDAFPNSAPSGTIAAPASTQELTVAGQMMLERQQALREYFSTAPRLTRESFALEITLVARAAVSEAQYQAAAKLYELAGKHLGAITPAGETHQHVHLHQNSPENDFTRATDAELRRIIEESQLARQHATVTRP